MKSTFLVLALLATGAGPVAAQAPAGGPQPGSPAAAQPPDRRAQYLAKELGLSPDQQAKLGPIMQARRQELQALRNPAGTTGRQPGMGRELKAAQSNYLDQIKAVLTPEQYLKFTQLQDEQRRRLREQRQNGEAAPMQD